MHVCLQKLASLSFVSQVCDEVVRVFSISLFCRVKVYFAILIGALLWACLARNVRLRSQFVYSVLNMASSVYHARVDLLNVHSQAEMF